MSLPQARVDRQPCVDVLEGDLKIVSDGDVDEQREGTVAQVHHHAGGGLRLYSPRHISDDYRGKVSMRGATNQLRSS